MKIKTGLVGAGAFGANHANKLASLPLSAFQGLYDADAVRAQEAAARHGVRAFASLEALLDAVDAIVVASPARTHAAIGLAAVQAGKHALIEKPLAATAAEARAIAEGAKARGVIVQAGHQERYVLDALGLLRAPEKPLRIESVRETNYTGRGTDVSVTLDLMIHDLDLVALLFGGAPTSVSAEGIANPGPELDDVTAKLTFAGGEAHLRSSRIAPARRRTLRAVYPSGEVRLDFLTRTLTNTTPFALDPDFADKVKDPLGRNVETFLEAVAAGGPSVISADAGAQAVALAEAVDAACRN